MKSLTFIVLSFLFFCFSNSAFGQMDKLEKKIIPYDSQIGDWDIVIPLPTDLVTEEIYDISISVSGGTFELPAQITEKGFELIHPSELYLNDGIGYYFTATYHDESGQKQETAPLSMCAPTLDVYFGWTALDYKLSTKVLVSDINDFTPNMDNSYFYTIDVLRDSIMEGTNKNFDARYWNSEFIGEKTISTKDIAIDMQYVGFLLRLDNDDGQVRLRGNYLSAFMVEGFFVITHNLTGRGAITPYMFDNKPRTATIIYETGAKVQDVIFQSDEPYWPPEGSPSGKYFAEIRKGFTTGQFMKINNF